MKIQDLFERDIHRSINGVVKADQLDAFSVWQELDEFVVTRELNKYINDLEMSRALLKLARAAARGERFYATLDSVSTST